MCCKYQKMNTSIVGTLTFIHLFPGTRVEPPQRRPTFSSQQNGRPRTTEKGSVVSQGGQIKQSDDGESKLGAVDTVGHLYRCQGLFSFGPGKSEICSWRGPTKTPLGVLVNQDSGSCQLRLASPFCSTGTGTGTGTAAASALK